MDILKKKAKEKAPVEAPEAGEEEEAGPADLVAALKESMRKVKKKR
jgi:non-homologous end joining protein Ku